MSDKHSDKETTRFGKQRKMQALPAYPMSHYVYLVQCADGTLYTGYAKDVQQRVAVHNTGKGARYTRTRLPVTLLASWHFPTQSAALKREYQIKQLTRQQKLALSQSSVHAEATPG